MSRKLTYQPENSRYFSPYDISHTVKGESHPPTDAELLRRRAAALKMRAQGHTQAYIAQRLNVSQTAVANWELGKQRGHAPRTFENPPTGPLEPPQLGRAPYVTDDQLRELMARRSGKWTGAKLQRAVFETFGVTYSPCHCCRILRYLRRDDVATRFAANCVAKAASA